MDKELRDTILHQFSLDSGTPWKWRILMRAHVLCYEYRNFYLSYYVINQTYSLTFGSVVLDVASSDLANAASRIANYHKEIEEVTKRDRIMKLLKEQRAA